ncbi:hypothetical protein [Flavobacterium aestuarii]|uniref:hypothetical protein n=1 Tax=Flavobacterium aestuarii TaxID=3149227 RepID=UPI0032B36EB0
MEAELSQFLSQKSVLGADSVEILLKFWKKEKRLKSKDLLLNFNQQDSNLYFVKKGCVRLFQLIF